MASPPSVPALRPWSEDRTSARALDCTGLVKKGATVPRVSESLEAPGGREKGRISNRPANTDLATLNRASWTGLTVALIVRAVVNPRVAIDLIRLVWAFRARGWYRQPPFLPIPPSEYVRWRMHTAYGDEDAIPPVGDVIRFARWRREVMGL